MAPETKAKKVCDAIYESKNPLITLLVNIMWEAQRQKAPTKQEATDA